MEEYYVPNEMIKRANELLNALKFTSNQLTSTVGEIEDNWELIEANPPYGTHPKDLQYEKLSDHAERFGVSYNTILKWNKEGLLEDSIRIGGTILVPKDCIYKSAEKINQFTEQSNEDTKMKNKEVDLSWNYTPPHAEPYKWKLFQGDLTKDSHTTITADSSYNSQEIITHIMNMLNKKNENNIEFTIITKHDYENYNKFVESNDNAVIIQANDENGYAQLKKELDTLLNKKNEIYKNMSKINEDSRIIGSLYGRSLDKLVSMKDSIDSLLEQKIQIIVLDDVHEVFKEENIPHKYYSMIDYSWMSILRTGRSANQFIIINNDQNVKTTREIATTLVKNTTNHEFK